MTCRSLMSSLDDLSSAWKYQIPAVSKSCQNSVAPSDVAENLHVCLEDHGIGGLSGKVGPSTLEQLENAFSARRTEPTRCNMLELKKG